MTDMSEINFWGYKNKNVLRFVIGDNSSKNKVTRKLPPGRLPPNKFPPGLGLELG